MPISIELFLMHSTTVLCCQKYIWTFVADFFLNIYVISHKNDASIKNNNIAHSDLDICIAF